MKTLKTSRVNLQHSHCTSAPLRYHSNVPLESSFFSLLEDALPDDFALDGLLAEDLLDDALLALGVGFAAASSVFVSDFFLLAEDSA